MLPALRSAQAAAVLVGIIVALGPPTAAQEADPPARHAPLIITDEKVGILRESQVGSLILPQGTPPFPAMVVLHGCNGVSPNTRVWARRLAAWGYAALIIDSFSRRGLHQVCDGSRAFPGPERAKDAFAAAAYLRARPDIDGARIGLLGYSHGGWTALNASTEKNVAEAGAAPFRAIVAFYPYCPAVAPPLASDVQIFIGGGDDWAKPERCTAFVEKYAEQARHRPNLVVYPGAKHSFEANVPERVYYGHTLAYDPKATADALERTRKFLDERMQSRP
jgi:dienelactone hydrolase